MVDEDPDMCGSGQTCAEAFARWLRAPKESSAPTRSRRTHRRRPAQPVLDALARARAAGCRVLLVTGRILSELRADTGVLRSTMGRHLARAIETKFVADAMSDWIMQFKLGEPVLLDNISVIVRGPGATDPIFVRVTTSRMWSLSQAWSPSVGLIFRSLISSISCCAISSRRYSMSSRYSWPGVRR